MTPDNYFDDLFLVCEGEVVTRTYFGRLSPLNWKPAKSPRIIWDEETLMPLADVNGSTVPAATGANEGLSQGGKEEVSVTNF